MLAVIRQATKRDLTWKTICRKKKRRKAGSDEEFSEPSEEDACEEATGSYGLRPPKEAQAADVALESDIAQLQVGQGNFGGASACADFTSFCLQQIAQRL